MPVTLTTISPNDGDTNIELNSEIVFRLVNSTGVVNLSTLGVTFTVDTSAIQAISTGSFVNNFDGEFIDNIGDGSDITVVIIRPLTSPKWLQGKIVQVGINISLV